jgi:hypothetical protein
MLHVQADTRCHRYVAAAAQVAGEPEVKAQIKLRIRTAQGAPIVIVRSFQLVQKAKALQVYSLDMLQQIWHRAI